MNIISEFCIPALPPSLNMSYKINYRTRRVYLHESVRHFKILASSCIPSIKVSDKDKLHVDVQYYGKFLNKDKSTKRKDGQNLDKILYDVIFTVFGVDDKVVWSGSWEKIHAEEENTKVKIYRK